MKRKSKFAGAFTISLALHIIACIIGVFFWYNPKPSVEQEGINADLIHIEKPKTKRMTRPKRAQIRKQTTQTNQANLKVLTSNAPPTARGVVSAREPTKFNALDSLNLGDGVELSNNSINLDQGMPQLQRVIESPIQKKKPVEETRPKSRLVQFIEKQEGPQRIVYCIDLSSSMLGLTPRKLDRIISIIQDSLTFLEPHDRFNVLTFSSKIEPYQPGFLAVSEESVSQAIAYLDTAKPTKSTRYADKDMLEGIVESKKTQPTIIVLFSDGILTSGVPNPQLIRQHATGNAKLFTMATEMAEDFPGAVLLGMLADGSNGEFWLVD